jgi:hypothetical protein
MPSKGVYIVRNCVPDGAFDIANVSPGTILSRSFTFRANADLEVQSSLDSGNLPTGAADPTKVLRGCDGILFDNDLGVALLQVNTWHLSYNVANTEWDQAGSCLRLAVPTAYSITLTFTETVIRDSDVLARVMAAARGATTLTFKGVLNPRA